MSRTLEGRKLAYDHALSLLNVDVDTGSVTWRVGACRSEWEGKEAGSVVGGRRKLQVAGVSVWAANLVWYVKTGVVPPSGVKHLNGNRLDSRITNLALASKRKVFSLTQQSVRERFDYRINGLYYRLDFPNAKARAGGRAGSVTEDDEYDYAVRVIKVCGRYYRESHLVWLYHKGSLPVQQLDHINGDPLDNRIENLRECSPAENQQNRRLSKDNTSGLIGAWPLPNGRWGSSISVNGVQIRLGTFNTAEEAHSAYMRAKASHHKFNPIPREAHREIHIP